MELMRWNPLRELDLVLGRNARGAWPGLGEAGSVPAVDISETDKEYVIKADLAGVDKKDIKLTAHNGVLTLEAERQGNKEEKGEKWHRTERYFGHYERSFSLPDDVDESRIKAQTKDGEVHIHLPKVEAKTEQRKQIPVN